MKRPVRTRAIIVVSIAAIAVAGLALGFVPAGPPGYGARLEYGRIIGPPPAQGSAAAAADAAAFVQAAAGIGDSEWRAAGREIFPSSTHVRVEAGCALGHPISIATTPATMRLLQRAAADLQPPVEAAKAHFARDRPFVGADDPRSCDIRTLGPLGRLGGGLLSYSYPSGHAAFGKLAALVLTDAVPARAGPLTAWGRALGDHRVACRVHWPSDIVAGRQIAVALHTRLLALPGYRADVAAARTELASAPAAACQPGGG